MSRISARQGPRALRDRALGSPSRQPCASPACPLASHSPAARSARRSRGRSVPLPAAPPATPAAEPPSFPRVCLESACATPACGSLHHNTGGLRVPLVARPHIGDSSAVLASARPPGQVAAAVVYHDQAVASRSDPHQAHRTRARLRLLNSWAMMRAGLGGLAWRAGVLGGSIRPGLTRAAGTRRGAALAARPRSSLAAPGTMRRGVATATSSRHTVGPLGASEGQLAPLGPLPTGAGLPGGPGSWVLASTRARAGRSAPSRCVVRGGTRRSARCGVRANIRWSVRCGIRCDLGKKASLRPGPISQAHVGKIVTAVRCVGILGGLMNPFGS